MPKEKEQLQNAFRDLEKIVEELNTKDIDVEVALKKFKEGVELIEYCRGELKRAENEFTLLKTRLEEGNNSESNSEDDE